MERSKYTIDFEIVIYNDFHFSLYEFVVAQNEWKKYIRIGRVLLFRPLGRKRKRKIGVKEKK